MYRISVCDDDSNVCSFVEAVILEYSLERNVKIDVDVFHSGEKFYHQLLNGNYYDMVILDIEMGYMNGLEVSHNIRNILKNEVMDIIFISNHQNYSMQLFEYRPINFLIKPLSKEKIISNINKSMTLSDKFNQQFIFHVGRTMHKIPFKNIVYFMSDAKKVKVFLNDSEYEFYGKLSSVINTLPSKDFFFIHKSYIVNFKYVKQYRHDSLILTTGLELNISQTYRKAVRNYLMETRKEC